MKHACSMEMRFRRLSGLDVKKIMKINESTKINDLLKKYPFLEDFMPSISKEYRLLKNKLVRNTIGKIATLKRVAAIGKVPLEELLIALSAKIREVANEEIQIEIDGEILEPQSPASRQEDIKRIIKDIHAGKDPEQKKKTLPQSLMVWMHTSLPRLNSN